MTRSEGRLVLGSVGVSALAGAAYAAFAHGMPGLGLVVGGVFGAVVPLLEIVAFKGEAGARLRRAPFLVFLGARIAAYLVLVAAVQISLVWLLEGAEAARGVGAADMLFTLALCVIGNLLFAVADLLGPGVLLAFAAGRYHRPRPEERALLFVDLIGSTAKAERLGEVRFLEFLDAFLADVSRDIVENGGEVHKYVGDEVIGSWRLRPGRNAIGILRAWIAARERLGARREAYQRAFGEAADFRAALHAGVVVIGEIGLFKKEIAMIGDPMNTAARMLDAARELGRPALASAALIERLAAPAPEGVVLCPIAPLPLRGKAEPLALVALAPGEAPVREGLLAEA